MRNPDHPLIDLYFAPGPDAWAVTIALEECGLPYQVLPAAEAVRLDDEFPAVGPEGLSPALVDHETGVHVFEAGAVLQYLGEKTERFLPLDPDGKYQVLQWLFWPGARLTGADQEPRVALEMMEWSLGRQPWLAGEYSLADMAIYPWVAGNEWLREELGRYAGVRRWYEGIRKRTGVRRGMAAH